MDHRGAVLDPFRAMLDNLEDILGDLGAFLVPYWPTDWKYTFSLHVSMYFGFQDGLSHHRSATFLGLVQGRKKK